MNERRRERLGRLAIWVLDHGQKFFLTQDVGVAERRGERLGMLWYRLDRKHRERAHANLALAFPEWTAERRNQVAQGSFRHYGRVTGDFLRTPIRTNAEVLANIEVDGFENFELAATVDRGVLAVTAHVGNFERFGHYCTATGRKIAVVARDANQSGVQKRIEALRLSTGVELISRGDAVRPILARLRRKEIVGLIPDQNDTECFVPFFGKPAGTVLGPAVLHQRTGAAILPGFCLRTGVGKYRVIIREPIDLANEEPNPAAIMTRINAVIQAVIREYPDQWLWMHDRWKTARVRGMLD